jgi:tetratricopeptide (TPR) repeat protein
VRLLGAALVLASAGLLALGGCLGRPSSRLRSEEGPGEAAAEAAAEAAGQAQSEESGCAQADSQVGKSTEQPSEESAAKTAGGALSPATEQTSPEAVSLPAGGSEGRASGLEPELPAGHLPEPASEEAAEVYSGPGTPDTPPRASGPGFAAGPLPAPPVASPLSAASETPKASSGAKKAAASPPKASGPQAAAPSPAGSGSPAPQGAVAGSAAPSGSPRAAGSGAAASVGPSAAAPGSAAASASSGQAGSPASREVLARAGDTVVIDLEGRGWLFLGLPGGSRGVSFAGSEPGSQRTSFSFKALELGEYDLAFQLQDNTRGVMRSQVVHLRVLPEEQFRSLVQSSAQPAGAAVQPAISGAAPVVERIDPARLEKAERLFRAGLYDLALPEYLAVYREGDALLNDRLAAIYLGRGDAASAAAYYEKNLTSPAPYPQKAALGLVRAGLKLGSAELVLGNLPAVLGQGSVDIEAELLEAARLAAGQGRYPVAQDLLSEYLRRYPKGDRMDRALFQLAQLYELESPLRDVRLARSYYSRLYDEFPESEYAPEAHARILYLDRYFFHVQ